MILCFFTFIFIFCACVENIFILIQTSVFSMCGGPNVQHGRNVM